MIRGIIFDCFGVLYGGSLPTLISMCPPERLEDLRDINKRADYGFITTEEYAAALGEILSLPYEEVVKIFHAKHIRNDELINFVKELHKDYKTAMLSNVGTETIERLFSQAELDEMFDTVVLSYQEHIAKPNPEIFALTAARLGLSAGECVMIDDLESNCDGAEIAGMQSIQHITNDGTRVILASYLQESA